MSFPKRKGYRVERKIRMIFEKNGWKVVRAGGSFGDADLICLKKGKCILVQVKSTRKDKLYYYGKISKKIEGFPFYVVVDFGFNRIVISRPKKIIGRDEKKLEDFLLNK